MRAVEPFARHRRRPPRRRSPTLSEIAFDHLPGPHGRNDIHQIVPRIDTVPLTDLIDTFEIGAGMEPAGGAYAGLVPEFVHLPSPIDHYHGSARLTWEQRTPLLGCSCGELRCWPLQTRITLTGDLVAWDRFEQPFRPDRDYTTFGPFLFDRAQYDQAARRLGRTIAADESSP